MTEDDGKQISNVNINRSSSSKLVDDNNRRT